MPGERDDGIRVVTLPGQLDHGTAAAVLTALTRGLAGGVTAVIADLTATSYCTLEGVAALLHARTAAATTGAQLRVATASPDVQQILERTGAAHALALYPSVQAALDGSNGHHGNPGTTTTGR